MHEHPAAENAMNCRNQVLVQRILHEYLQDIRRKAEERSRIHQRRVEMSAELMQLLGVSHRDLMRAHEVIMEMNQMSQDYDRLTREIEDLEQRMIHFQRRNGRNAANRD